ncbi:unnamed protein product [Orchesella dallaii]|uniref:Uncharacterized protein n=1 Tax=Orchesella dallaii TaxID=48710 RepID=A0ABP1QJI0_9HEXA
MDFSKLRMSFLTCDSATPARAKGVPSKSDEVCKQYIDGDYFHTYSKEDCNEDDSLSCCEGVCNCCKGPTCTNDTCDALQIVGGESSSLTCDSATPARAKGVPSKSDEVCKQYIDGDYFHTYSKEDCNEDDSLSCCEGVCNCCKGPTCTNDTCDALQIVGGESSSVVEGRLWQVLAPAEDVYVDILIS